MTERKQLLRKPLPPYSTGSTHRVGDEREAAGPSRSVTDVGPVSVGG